MIVVLLGLDVVDVGVVADVAVAAADCAGTDDATDDGSWMPRGSFFSFSASISSFL